MGNAEGARHARRARARARAGRRGVRREEGGGSRRARGSGGGEATAAKDCGKVTLNEQAWAGSTANTYIAKAVLEDELGCEVEITKVAEIPVFQAMADGKVDAVLEDWQHIDEYKKYIEEAGTVVDGGPLGVEGHIGWFIPKYLMDEQPGVRDLGGPEGQGGPVQDRRVRRPGHVPRRRSRPTSRRTRS